MTELITIQEAAKYVGVARVTIYKWVHCGKLPAVNFGRFYGINKFDLIGLTPGKRGRKRKVLQRQDELQVANV